MDDKKNNNRRIARNTILLYMRMLLMMVVNLYTSRVVLTALGVQDYGIYNVVGGVVAMFSVLSGSLSSAISRFITFELGRDNIERLKKIFSTSINVQFIIILIIFILSETIGLWFMNNKLVIGDERLNAANWVFQFSVITFAVNLWSVPYNASIIAHEKMSVFAYISLFDAFAKLAISFLIFYSPIDRLVFYGLLLLLAGVVQRFLYSYYCKKHFEECKYCFSLERSITKELFSFAGWSFIGTSAHVLRTHGVNVLINLFFGPTVNAGRGIAVSLMHAVNAFCKNFMIALNPQITKSYSKSDYEYMFRLAFQGARLSFYIILIIALPVIMTTPYLLHLWLGKVPDFAIIFTRLSLIFTMSESLSGTLGTIALATGSIRNYQIIVGGCQLMNLPISYLFLKLGFPPQVVYCVAIGLSILCGLTKVYLTKRMVNLPIMAFLKDVYANVAVVSILSAAMPFVLMNFLEVRDFMSFILMVAVTLICTLFVIYYVGCSKHDRTVVNNIIIGMKMKLLK